jgi:hypothetical protein
VGATSPPQSDHHRSRRQAIASLVLCSASIPIVKRESQPRSSGERQRQRLLPWSIRTARTAASQWRAWEAGLDRTSERARQAIGVVRDNTWGPEFDDAPFFEGEVEPCINGRVLALGACFGEASDRLVDRLLHEQLEDGGWNCEAPPSKRSSFHTTICVLAFRGHHTRFIGWVLGRASAA